MRQMPWSNEARQRGQGGKGLNRRGNMPNKERFAQDESFEANSKIAQNAREIPEKQGEGDLAEENIREKGRKGVELMRSGKTKD